MSPRLKGKVAIITGAGMGIGETMAIMFAREGAKVIIADINAAAGENTAKQVKANGGEAAFVLTDVSREQDVKAMVKKSVEAFGRVDVLCNNAGIALAGHGDGPVTKVSEETLDRLLAVNLKGPFFCCKHVVPEMVRAGGGSIINISSVATILGRPELSAYTAAKGGLDAITRAIAAEFAANKVRCNVMCISATVTPMAEEFLKDPEHVKHYMTPIGRLGTREDIAYCALYLASEESSWVTGQTFVLDGGQSIKG